MTTTPQTRSADERCTCGANEFEGCFCNLTFGEFQKSLIAREARYEAKIALASSQPSTPEG